MKKSQERSLAETQDILIQALHQCLGETSLAKVDEQGSFHILGLSSKQIVQLATLASEKLGQELSIAQFYAHPSIQALSQALHPDQMPRPPRLASSPADRLEREDIAIVGIGVRLPDIASADDFYSALLERQCTVGRYMEDRRVWMQKLFPGVPLQSLCSFLEQPFAFDSQAFRISPAEAETMDPQQRLALMVAHEAMLDSGYDPQQLMGSRSGVFLGAVWHDYTNYALEKTESYSTTTATGLANSVIANRLSYHYGLTGPSLIFDTACSSSLVAVHYACQSLRLGECDYALAGGVNLILDPRSTRLLETFGGLSPSGRIHAFDARADGFVRGEGCGILALKTLRQARRDNDRIYAVISGSATNNDGATQSLTAPSARAQSEAITQALQASAMQADAVHYVECHGTGTALGDPIEVEGLTRGYQIAQRPDHQTLRIGSVKTNFGHLEAAAGVISVIKCALMVKHQTLLPTLHFEKPNPHINFQAGRIQVQQDTAPLPTDAVLGISSFGWGGTNAHVLIKSVPSIGLPTASDEAPRQAAALKTVFVFSPQGGQWFGMLQGLMRAFPCARATLERFDRSFRELAHWSILDALYDACSEQQLHKVAFAQPLLIAAQITLVEVLKELGVTPDICVGHSLGEIAAAYGSGALDIADVARLVYFYSLRQEEIQPGAMAILGTSRADAQVILEPYAEAYIAGENGSHSLILTGMKSDLVAVVEACSARKIFARLIQVDRPVHCHFIDPIQTALAKDLEQQRFRPLKKIWYSTVHARRLHESELGKDYWFTNLRSEVRFWETIQTIERDHGPVNFVEINTHPVLLDALLKSEGGPDASRIWSSLHRDRDEAEDVLRLKAALGQDMGYADQLQMFCMSSHASETLQASGKKFSKLLQNTSNSMESIAFSLAERYERMPHRVAWIARDRAELLEKVEAWQEGGEHPDVFFGLARPAKTLLVFSGQGSQWPGMVSDLLRVPGIFQDTVVLVSRILGEYDCPEIYEQLLAGSNALHERIDRIQPALFTIQVALVEYLNFHGFKGEGVIGHSMGEVAAAYASGHLSLRDAACVIARRSQALLRIRGLGAMLYAELSLDTARSYLQEFQGLMDVGVNNSPTTVVFSGEPLALQTLKDTLDQRQIFCRWVKVDVASHSPQVEPLLKDLMKSLEHIAPRSGLLPFYSPVTKDVYREEAFADAAYWAKNLRQTVLFQEAIANACRDGANIFLELSPHPLLTQSIKQCVSTQDQAIEVLGSLHRDEQGPLSCMRLLARSWVHGLEGDAGSRRRSQEFCSLPLKSWRNILALLPPPIQVPGRGRPAIGFRGVAFDLPHDPGTFITTIPLDPTQHALLQDHRIAGEIVAPAAVFLEIFLNQRGEESGRCLEHIQLLAPLILSGATWPLLNVVRKASLMEIYSRSEGGGWILHAKAQLAEHTAACFASEHQAELPGVDKFYPDMATFGYEFGPTFQRLKAYALGSDACYARVETTAATADYQWHPAVLDSCFHIILAEHRAREADSWRNSQIVVTEIGRFLCHRNPPANAELSCRLTRHGETYAIAISTQDHQMIADLQNIRLQKIPRAQAVTPVLVPLLNRSGPELRVSIQGILRSELSRILKMPGKDLEAQTAFSHFGLTSLMTLEFIHSVNAKLGTGLASTVAFNFPTIERLTRHLLELLQEVPPPADVDDTDELLMAIAELEKLIG